MIRGKGRASERHALTARGWPALCNAAEAALLSAALLGACESGDSTRLTESARGASGATPLPATPGGAANPPEARGAEATPKGSSEGAATRDVAVDTTGAAPTMTAAAIPDAGGPEASDAGASRDASAPAVNDCCSVSGSGGCSDPVIAACVCEGDSACCESSYDALCVNQAVSRCGLRCDDRAPVSDCCGASDVPGCTLPDVAECICAIDPFCCVFRFDQNCVNLGLSQCNAVCGEEALP